MEKLGEGNKVHLTRETAAIIEGTGKKHWVEAREASKAGNTYWLTAAHGLNRRASCSHAPPPPTSSNNLLEQDVRDYHPEDDDETLSERSDGTAVTSASTAVSDGATKSYCMMQDILAAKEQRLIEWTVDQLALMLKKIVARRQAVQRYEARKGKATPEDLSAGPPVLHYSPPAGCVLDEVREMVEIPRIKVTLLVEEETQYLDSVELPARVMEELTNFVSTVTTFYYDPARNPFHNFTHASHVLVSVVKMMQRIISPVQAAMEKDRATSGDDDDITPEQGNGKRRRGRRRVTRKLSRSELTDHTYGITEDPLIQFSVVFAALIHDLDHPGVPNAQLVKEETRLARIYKNRSISEQNSLDMAWDLLMDPSYQCLVRTICGSQEELKRFRQLLVQTVMATDIADAELRNARNKRWDLAFAKKDGGDEKTESPAAVQPAKEETSDDDNNRKATIVLEHLLQASDIAHTMQHFDVFRKWNERLFREMYLAYLSGRAEKDPGEYWYVRPRGVFL